MWRTGTIFLRCEELVLNFHKCEESVPNSQTCEESVPKPHICEELVANYHSWKIDIKTHMCEELVPNPRTCEKLALNHHRLVWWENWCFIVTDVSDKTVKNWNRMQNVAAWGGAILSMIGIRMYAIWHLPTCVQVPIFRALWVIGTNSSQFKICELWNLRSPYRHEQAGRDTPMLEYLMR